MTRSRLRPQENLKAASFDLKSLHCSVYVPDGGLLSPSDQFSWPEIVAGLLDGTALDHEAARSGRGGVFFFAGEGADQILVVRQYRHGGFLRLLLGARFLSRKRFLSELKIHNRAAELGVPVPKAVAVVVTEARHNPVFVNGYFATLKLSDSMTLPEFLYRADSRTRLKIFAEIGEYLKRLHENGIYYADMQVRNILVTPSGRVYLIDFDKSSDFAGPLPRPSRRANLRRFWRSLAKYSERGGRLTESDRAAFLLAYAPDSKAYTEFYQHLHRALFLRRIFYRLGWLLNRS